VRTSSGEANPDRIFDQIVQTTKLERQNGMDRFTVNLKPGFLGRIEIETDIRSDEGVHAVIRVEDPAVKKAVEKGLADLLDQLGDLGVDIDSAEVSDFQASEQERNGEQSTAPSSNRLRNRNSAGVAIDDPESTGAAGNDSGVFSYFA
jgi:flagellar hook-length control protein FliK